MQFKDPILVRSWYALRQMVLSWYEIENGYQVGTKLRDVCLVSKNTYLLVEAEDMPSR